MNTLIIVWTIKDIIGVVIVGAVITIITLLYIASFVLEQYEKICKKFSKKNKR